MDHLLPADFGDPVVDRRRLLGATVHLHSLFRLDLDRRPRALSRLALRVQLGSGALRGAVRRLALPATDEWPPFGLSDDPNYPIKVDIAPREEHQSRLKALFRLVLALPMLLVSYAVNYMHLWVALVAWVTIVFRGYQPEGINTALTFVNGFYARLYGYVAFLTDDYPPIGAEKAGGPTDADPGTAATAPVPA
jgi:hypothetical protein